MSWQYQSMEYGPETKRKKEPIGTICYSCDYDYGHFSRIYGWLSETLSRWFEL